MKAAYPLFGLLCLISFSALSEKGRSSLTINTEINVNGFYEGAFDKVYFVPEKLDLVQMADRSSYEATQTQLKIETTIPKSMSNISYYVKLARNEVWCTDYAGVETKRVESGATPHFVTATISKLPDSGCAAGSDAAITYGGKETYADFCGDDGTNKTSVHTVKLAFAPFNYLINSTHSWLPQSCRGELDFTIEVEL